MNLFKSPLINFDRLYSGLSDYSQLRWLSKYITSQNCLKLTDWLNKSWVNFIEMTIVSQSIIFDTGYIIRNLSVLISAALVHTLVPSLNETIKQPKVFYFRNDISSGFSTLQQTIRHNAHSLKSISIRTIESRALSKCQRRYVYLQQMISSSWFQYFFRFFFLVLNNKTQTENIWYSLKWVGKRKTESTQLAIISMHTN